MNNGSVRLGKWLHTLYSLLVFPDLNIVLTPYLAHLTEDKYLQSITSVAIFFLIT